MKSRTKFPVPNDFDTATPNQEPAAVKNGELWSDRTPESLNTIRHLLDLSAVDTLKYECCIQLAHIQRMRELERRVGVLLPGFPTEMRKLLRLIRSVYEAQIAAAKKGQPNCGSEAASQKVPQCRGHVDLKPEEAEAVKIVEAFFSKMRDEVMRKE